MTDEELYNRRPVTMMADRPDPLECELEQILSTLAKQRGARFATQLRAILLTNLERGRIHFYLNGRAPAYLPEYVARVVQYFDRLNPYLQQLQRTKSPDAWEPLLFKLRIWISGVLQHLPGGVDDPAQLATDYADAAAEKILTAHFPYDTEFDPWAFVLARNVCLQQLRIGRRRVEPLDDDLLSLLPDLNHTAAAQRRELRQALLSAIEQLSSDARRKLIMLHYFQGSALPDIAAALDKTVTAVYKLHFDALAELRKIWAAQEHNNE